MHQSYEVGTAPTGHKLNKHVLVIFAGVIFVATRWSWLFGGAIPFIDHRVLSLIVGCITAIIAMCYCPNRIRIAVLALSIVFVGASGSKEAWRQVNSATLGSYRGPATVRADPEPFFAGQRVVLEIEGKRYEATAFGSLGRRLRQRLMGEIVLVEGTRSNLRPDRIKWVAPHHVVGTISLTSVSEQWSFGSPLYRSANRVRQLLAHSAEVMPDSEASLYLGLVIGDDRNQPEAMRNAFRSAGLSHLVAVSGQNVAFMLIALSPLLRRLRTWWRFIATVVALGWFVLLTRIEPSVLRAGAMAGLAAFGFARGLKVSPQNLLAGSVIALVFFDPMLVWSIGFLMSVGATAGLIAITPLLLSQFGQMGVPHWCALPLSVTLGAQLGVMPISLAVFHSAPIVGIVANLFAVPVAGFVMLAGLPLGLLSAVLPSQMLSFVMWPILVAVRWVWWVAVAAQRVSPRGIANVVGWATVTGIGLDRWRRIRHRASVGTPT